MAMISVTAFGGIAPKVPATMLEVKNAQVAINCAPNVSLIPLRGMDDTGVVVESADNSTIYRYGTDLYSDTQYWFHWAGRTVSVVRGALADDETERTYFVDTGVARVTDNALALVGGSGEYPWASYTLGVPTPNTSVNMVVSGTGAGAPESRYYIYTNVTGWGEESLPSPSSIAVDVLYGQAVTLTNFSAKPPASEYNVVARRIYRTASGFNATDFQFVAEISINDTQYVDTKTGTALGEVCPSMSWDPPPLMDGMVGMANGIVVGFKGTELFPSESYRPFAFPLGYRLSTNYDIVGVASFGNHAVVCTKGNPYLLYGTDPSSLSLTKVELPQACVSRRSIVEIAGGVVYASPDGLVYVSASEQARVITEKQIDRKFWQQLIPTSISGYVSEGRYIGFYNAGLTQGGFMYDPMTDDFVLLNFYATAGYQDLAQDALFLKVNQSIYKFEAGAAPYTYTWRSKVFNLPQPTGMSAVQVVAKDYPLTFRFYADGVLKHTQSVASSQPFRLPAGLANKIEFELEGTTDVYMVALATSVDELKGI